MRHSLYKNLQKNEGKDSSNRKEKKEMILAQIVNKKLFGKK